MKHVTVWMSCLAILAGLTGCIENAMLVKVKKDGSGSLVYRLYLSESMTGMMAQADPDGEVDLFAGMKDGLAEQLGGGAVLKSSKELTNKKGWKGMEAVFEFDDITALNLHDIDPMGGSEGPSATPSEDSSMGEDYTLKFVPGDVATLTLAPMVSEDDVAATEGAEDMDMDMSQMPMDMIKPMLSGMRMTLLVAVDGEIVETNSRFQSSKQPNVITVMDISMDRVLDHPEGAKLIQSGKSDDTEALAALDIPGVKIEKPGKEIVIRFR